MKSAAKPCQDRLLSDLLGHLSTKADAPEVFGQFIPRHKQYVKQLPCWLLLEDLGHYLPTFGGSGMTLCLPVFCERLLGESVASIRMLARSVSALCTCLCRLSDPSFCQPQP